MKKTSCVLRQEVAKELDNGCKNCKQGREIAEKIGLVERKRPVYQGKDQKPKPKPPPKKTVEKPQPKRQKIRTPQQLNFQRIMNKWNREHGKKWTALGEWMSWMYHTRHNGCLKHFSNEIEISQWSLRRKLVFLGVYNEAFRLYPALEDKPMCLECGKYHSWCKGLCKSCYQRQYREMKKREAR
jgi:hypothetical protein